MKFNYFKYGLCILYILITQISYSQNTKISSLKFSKEMNVSVSLPNRYVLSDSVFCFTGDDARPNITNLSKLVRKDGKVAILIELQPAVLVSDETINKRKLLAPSYNPDSNYIYIVREYATSKEFFPLDFGHDFARLNFNADDAVMYERYSSKTKNFTHNRVLMISKRKKGFVQLIFLFKRNWPKKKMKKEILEVSKSIVRFEEK